MRRDNEKPGTELTAPHRKLVEIIQQIGFEVLAEYAVGPYMLDCWLPEFWAGIEVDGPGHFKKRDATRDKNLMDRYCIPILRVTDVDVASRPEWVIQSIREFTDEIEDSMRLRKAFGQQYERTFHA